MKKANPDMTPKEKKKKGQQALSRNRIKYGARRNAIDISQNQWHAIQAGAVSENVLKKILRFADLDQVRSYATPKSYGTMSPGKQAQVRSTSQHRR